MYARRPAPTGSRIVKAASGPCAEDERPSSPRTGTPAATPIFWPASSDDANGLPRRVSRVVMTGAPASKDYANPWAPRVSIDREDGLVRARSVGPPESHAPLAKGRLDPRAPPLHTIVARDLRPRRKPPEVLERKARGALHQTAYLELPRREPGSGERLVLQVLGAGRAIGGKYRRPVGLGEFPGHGPARPERLLDSPGQPLGALEEGRDRGRARQAVAAGEQAECGQLERAASELPAIKPPLSLHLAPRKAVDTSRGSSTADCSRTRSPGP